MKFCYLFFNLLTRNELEMSLLYLTHFKVFAKSFLGIGLHI